MYPGGVDKRQIASLMRQFGIKEKAISAKRVIIEKTDGGKIIIEPADVKEIDMQGSINYQVGGKIKSSEGSGVDTPEEEETEKDSSEQDIAMVAEAAKVSKIEAKDALEQSNGDIAEAIMKLEQRKNR